MCFAGKLVSDYSEIYAHERHLLCLHLRGVRIEHVLTLHQMQTMLSLMPARIIPLINNQIYHVYNRGVEKRKIFENRRSYIRFMQTMEYYQLQGPKPKFSNFTKLFELNPDDKIIDILCYCLMPNHFHLLIKQLRENGISEFVSKLSNSYTKYYNVKFKRVGPLLQGQFKAVFIENDEQLMHVSRYIHLNPIASFLVNDIGEYEWSSYSQYIGKAQGFCVKEEILSLFKSALKYKQFVLDRVEYAQALEVVKHQLIDINN